MFFVSIQADNYLPFSLTSNKITTTPSPPSLSQEIAPNVYKSACVINQKFRTRKTINLRWKIALAFNDLLKALQIWNLFTYMWKGNLIMGNNNRIENIREYQYAVRSLKRERGYLRIKLVVCLLTVELEKV